MSDPAGLVLRRLDSMVAAAAAWLLVGVALALTVLTGEPRSIVATTCGGTATALAIWLVLWRPALHVEDDAVTVVNPLRSHRVPYGALIDWRVGGMAVLTVRTDRGEKRVTSWNAPGIPRRHSRRGTPDDVTTFALRQATGARPDDGQTTATCTPNTGWWLLVGALIALTIASSVSI